MKQANAETDECIRAYLRYSFLDTRADYARSHARAIAESKLTYRGVMAVYLGVVLVQMQVLGYVEYKEGSYSVSAHLHALIGEQYQSVRGEFSFKKSRDYYACQLRHSGESFYLKWKLYVLSRVCQGLPVTAADFPYDEC